MKHQFGMVLSGGGVRGAAHIGLLQALKEEGVRPTVISGVSAGAIVGSLYCAGYEPEEILAFFKDVSLFKWSNYNLAKPGLLDSEKFTSLFEPYLGDRRFEDLEGTLHIAATDLLRGACHIFSSGAVTPAVLASAAFPFVFSPVRIGDSLFADGGTVNNLPIEPLQECCAYCLGSYVNPLMTVKLEELDNTLAVLSRTFLIATNYNALSKLEECDWQVAPEELMEFNMFDTGRADEVFEIGYAAGREVAPKIAEKLSR